MDFLKTVTGKVAAGLAGLAVVAGGISWWQMGPDARHAVVSGVGKILAWLGVVLLLPWATFFLIGRVARAESNAAGAALVLSYCAIEAGILAWLFDWSISGATGWVFYAAAVLVAGVYNLLTCDWIAEKVA
jgi:hypothetical protein